MAVPLRRPPRAAPCRCHAWRRGGGRWQSERIAVPDELAAVVAFGNAHPGAVTTKFWEAVVQDMHAFVGAHVPDGASRVRAVLDPEALEVILSYRVEQRARP